MRIKTKNILMYSGVAVCAAGMVAAFVVPGLPLWGAAIVIGAGALLAFICAFLASRHVYQDGEDTSDGRADSAYQSISMASGMCLGAAVSLLVTKNMNVGMPVGMAIGFLVGSLTKKK